MKNSKNDLFHSVSNNRSKILLIIIGILFTLLSSKNIYAEPYDQCVKENKIETFIFCYQIKRKLEMEQSVSSFEISFNKQHIISENDPIRVSSKIVMPIQSETQLIKPSNNRKFYDLKPEIVSRHYEKSISVLDEIGKNNLLYCFERVKLDKLHISHLNQKFYIKAMQKILHTQIEGSFRKTKLPKYSVNQNNCGKLINLVIG